MRIVIHVENAETADLLVRLAKNLGAEEVVAAEPTTLWHGSECRVRLLLTDAEVERLPIREDGSRVHIDCSFAGCTLVRESKQ